MLYAQSCASPLIYKNRLEAFSDCVITITITIMVLGKIEPPDRVELGDLLELVPKFLSYALSFLFVGVFWNNHHLLLQAVRVINGRTL